MARQVGSHTPIGYSADIEMELRYLSTFKSRKIVCKIKLQIIINESYCDPNLLFLVC